MLETILGVYLEDVNQEIDNPRLMNTNRDVASHISSLNACLANNSTDVKAVACLLIPSAFSPSLHANLSARDGCSFAGGDCDV